MALDQRVDRLERALADLAAAQARTEQALSRLTEAQARTEERLGRLEERMDRVEAALARLAEAQARTEERVGRLEERMDRVEAALARLAEAQARTEERVGRLEEAQARTEERLGRLEEAMVQTQEAVRSLAMQVGRLSDAVGFTLEDLARELTPAYLAKHYGIDIPGLDRRFFTVDGEEVEVDFYGEGQRDGTAVAIIGEVRSRIYGRDVEAAVQTAQRFATLVPGEVVTVLFGFVIHPSARDVAGRLGAILITSSGR